MSYSLLDTIVKSALMNRGYSLHYYLPALKFSSDVLREMAMDDLKIVTPVTIPVTSYGAFKIPCDYLDWVRVGIPNGQMLKPLNLSSGFNRQYNYDTNGQPIKFPVAVQNNFDSVIFGVPFLSWYVNSYNSRGENTGGLYGYRSDGAPMTFEVFLERGEIQLSQDIGVSSIVLDYISDGRTINNASKIPTYSEATIEAYIDYGFAHNNRSIPDATKDRLFKLYVREREILRGRLNDMTTDTVMNIFRKNYTATHKS